MADDLREKVARAIHDSGPCDDTDCADPRDRGYCDKRADAVLAVLDPDALRAEVERLRAQVNDWRSAVRYSEAERDSAVREARAMRTGIEELIAPMTITRPDGSTLDAGGLTVRTSDLRALLAEHP